MTESETKQNRRRFLKNSALVATTLATGRRAFAANSPNERVRLAVLGLNGRGHYLAPRFAQLPNVEVAYLADPDSRLWGRTAASVEEISGKKPESVQDFRSLLDRNDVDALVVATPDHWHVLPTVWACQAGKDVYVEKPLSHNIIEGKAAVSAARKYNRVIQVGLQRRSADFLPEAIECVRSGILGKIGMARVWYTASRGDIGRQQDAPAPEGVDYDLWLGPAPKRPFNPNRFHYQWHWFWDYGTGELGNNGIHGLDLVRALLDLGLPKRVTSTGGMFHFDDDHETPDTQVITWEYPDLALLGEIRMWGGQKLEGSTFGVALYGDQGTLVTDGGGWELRRGDEIEKHGGDNGLSNHLADFVECVKTRAVPKASVREGHLSTMLCHTGNISHCLARGLQFDPREQVFVDDTEANEMLGREMRPPFTLPSGLLVETEPSGGKG